MVTKIMIKASKGEQKIAKILKQHGISFEQEASFSGLNGKHKVPLRFDFVVFDNNGILRCCIEIDGRQHFVYTPHFHKKYSDFLKQKERDRKKNQFCLSHGIPLIRIPYYDLDGLTFQNIFNTPQYIVKTQYHNDEIIRQGVR